MQNQVPQNEFTVRLSVEELEFICKELAGLFESEASVGRYDSSPLAIAREWRRVREGFVAMRKKSEERHRREYDPEWQGFYEETRDLLDYQAKLLEKLGLVLVAASQSSQRN